MQLRRYFSSLIQWTRSKQVTTRPNNRIVSDPELALPKPASLAIVLIANVFLQVSARAML